MRFILLFLLAASPALAERPADTLARLRGTPSTNSGALGSAFPQQYVEAYRYTPWRPILFAPQPQFIGYGPGCAPSSTISVGVQAGPVFVGGVFVSGGGVSHVACPAPGYPTTTVTTTTVTTTTVTGGGGVVLAPVLRDEPRQTRIVRAPLPRP